MSETTVATTELTSQYSTQVTGDLERNLKEQERVRGEIEALQAQLASLQQDHTVLVNIQQALGIPAAPAQPAPEAAAVPAPRKRKTAAAPGAGKQTRASRSAGAQKRNGKKSAAASPTAQSSQPKLVELVREHLAGQHEPRSAAEITTVLEQQHPEREIKTKIVRLTLEGLVAKNQAQRTKQGRSVFYTAPEAAEPTPQDEPAAQPSA
ncbi:hypothetical protein StrepF001_13025 [Streptomyces sp. F001]|uniref:hypothetical protein n=1 Tax=Streptomyces sp. F001 TaxID=1510026 RepID=UPI00101E8259|nr:hypothetical protein [Streptomyces sp. F001]RZB19738.1 hypothetical protein StrepF001_13025 [Streptomyces sp. F001]